MTSHRMSWIKQNPAACYQPFSTLSLRRHDTTDIHYTCCCNLNNGSIKTENQERFFQQLKNNIINGQLTAECSTCYRGESQGHFSERMRSLVSLDDKSFDEFATNYRAASVELAVKFSNLCPLACRSCQGSDSSTFAKIVKDPDRYKVLNQDLTEDPESWNIIIDQIIRYKDSFDYPALHVIGGETLVQYGTKKLVTWMHEQQLSQYFELRTTTSLAVDIKKELFDHMLGFKNICFVLSIDSVGENYRYVRWPVSFEKVERNLDLLLEKEKIYGRDFSLILSPVFSLNNIFYLRDYLDYFHQWMQNKNKFIEIRTTHLYHPEHLAVETLSPRYRSYLIDEISNQCEHPLFDSGRHPVLKNFIDALLIALKTEKPHSENSFRTFLKYTAEFDKRTNTSFEISNNRLWQLLNDEHKNIYQEQFNKSDVNIFIEKSIR